MNQSKEYRLQFLQNRYKTAFDGYTYYGQKGSSNQYEKDMLHSFVLSEFHPTSAFPVEFKPFFEQEWDSVINKVKEMEKQVISQLNIDGLVELYDHVIGHTIGCNYFPPVIEANGDVDESMRLTSHTDGSLFSVFPFGLDKGFTFKNAENQDEALGSKEETVLFNGYFLDYFMDGEIKALDHFVEMPDDLTRERFSFAFFSVPKPGLSFEFRGKQLTSEAYFQKYLDLF